MTKLNRALFWLLITTLLVFAITDGAKAQALIKDIIHSDNGEDRLFSFIFHEQKQPSFRNRPMTKLIIGVAGPRQPNKPSSWYQKQADLLVYALKKQNIEAINLWNLVKKERDSRLVKRRLQPYDAMLSLELHDEDDPIGARLRPSACNPIQQLSSESAPPLIYFHVELYSRYPPQSLWVADGCVRSNTINRPSEHLSAIQKFIIGKLLEENMVTPQLYQIPD